MHGPIYVRRYLLNLARLGVTTGLAVGLFGTAALLLAGRFLAAYGDLLFLAAVLLPVLVCLLGFEKKPLRAVGLTARRCDPGDFFFGMLWAAIGFLGILWVASLLTGQNDAWIALLQGASIPRLAHYLIVGFCSSADTCFRTCSASGPFGGGACSPRRSICCLTACVQAGTISRRSCLCVCLGSWRII